MRASDVVWRECGLFPSQFRDMPVLPRASSAWLRKAHPRFTCTAWVFSGPRPRCQLFLSQGSPWLRKLFGLEVLYGDASEEGAGKGGLVPMMLVYLVSPSINDSCS